MLWIPAVRVEVEHVAVFPVRAALLHSTVAPSVNATVPTPLGFPAKEVTVAVNVSASPYVLGLVPVVSATVVDVVLRAKKSLGLDVAPAARTTDIGRTPMFS